MARNGLEGVIKSASWKAALVRHSAHLHRFSVTSCESYSSKYASVADKRTAMCFVVGRWLKVVCKTRQLTNAVENPIMTEVHGRTAENSPRHFRRDVVRWLVPDTSSSEEMVSAPRTRRRHNVRFRTLPAKNASASKRDSLVILTPLVGVTEVWSVASRTSCFFLLLATVP